MLSLNAIGQLGSVEWIIIGNADFFLVERTSMHYLWFMHWKYFICIEITSKIKSYEEKNINL